MLIMCSKYDTSKSHIIRINKYEENACSFLYLVLRYMHL
ncbi:hypothetical protein NP493_858g01022 [Ridgeia piscesae]|uniref:Uncharacterized protein n=1 Tax=Ridgeia piscesae TaxID=27915 RepID=A0AAD9NMD3_RIDPI|nr:hypothetical protein NP493_858g01022 [Ridgeia piscesae]